MNEQLRIRRRILAGLGVLAIAATGAAWSGCGDDDEEQAVNDAIDQAQEAGEEAEEKANEAADDVGQEAEEAADELEQEADEAEQEDDQSSGGSGGSGY